jgi:hypothetical protein
MTPADLYRRQVWSAVHPLRKWRLLRLALRAGWVAGALVIIAAGIATVFGWAVTSAGWAIVWGAAFAVLFGALALRPVPLPGLVRRMDAALETRDQLSAAREVAERGPQNYVEARLLQSTESLLAGAYDRFQKTRAVPWDELELCLLVALVGYALSLNLGSLNPPRPPADYVPLPPLGAEPVVSLPGLPPELNAGLPPPFGAQADARQSALDVDPPSAQQALDALARALSESAATQSASNALAQGDAEQAADQLRQLSENAQSLSPETRAALAQSLREMADQLREAAPDLAEQLDRAAENLQSNDPGRVAEALAAIARLAEDLERAQRGNAATQSGEQTQGGASSFNSTAGREAQAGAGAERLGSEGEVIELPQGDAPSPEIGALQGPSRPAGDEPPSDGIASTGQGAGGGAGGESASDPLSYPWRWRDVVQGYFSTP